MAMPPDLEAFHPTNAGQIDSMSCGNRRGINLNAHYKMIAFFHTFATEAAKGRRLRVYP